MALTELHLKICGAIVMYGSHGITFKNMWCSWLSTQKRLPTPDLKGLSESLGDKIHNEYVWIFRFWLSLDFIIAD